MLGGARIYVKREDLNHTGAHKANNVMGQGLLVQRMGKRRVIAETGAGQHGVATATMAAKFGLACTIYMGEVDVARQRPNVFWMERLGADGRRRDGRHAHAEGRDQRGLPRLGASMDDTHYVLGTACGPHPFPEMVTYFQSIIGKEAREQMLELTGALPRRVYACVGGGSNALGIFAGFLDDAAVELVGVEAGGKGLDTDQHAARLAGGRGRRASRRATRLLPPERRRPDARDALRRRGPRLHRRLADPRAPARARAACASRRRPTRRSSRRCASRSGNEGLIPALECAHAFARRSRRRRSSRGPTRS